MLLRYSPMRIFCSTLALNIILMRYLITSLFLLFTSLTFYSQSIPDLFNKDVQITWLGIDFAQTKIIGEWAHFGGVGQQGVGDIRDKYFPGWNNLILSESDKYNLKSMMRQDDIYIDIGMIMDRNAEVSIRQLESYNPPNYSTEDIQNFVSSYELESKAGIGMVFISEYMSKYTNDALFHFVMLDLETRQILIHQACKVQPFGFGIRNYWAGSILDLIENIRDVHYPKWSRQYCE